MRSKKRFAAILLVMAMILSTTSLAAATTPRPVLTDIAGHPAEADINYLVGLGILAGFPDHTFRPAVLLSRAEAVKIIITATGQAELARLLVGASPFTDVPGTYWASGYIALAKNAGIVHGHGDGTFRPEDRVTYAQFAKMLVEAAGLDPTPWLTWPANYVAAARAAGIVTAADVPFFAADMFAPRGDAARMTTNAVADVRHPVHGTTLAQRVFRISPVAAVTVTPATSLVAPGAAVTFTGVARNAAGVAIPDAVFTWTTSDPVNSAIGANGVFVASRPGNFTVTGTADGTSATATVAVFGAATRIALAVDRPTVPANAVTEVVVTATAVDALGNRVATFVTPVTLSHHVNNGAVALPVVGTATPVAGVATFRLTASTIPDRTDTIRIATVPPAVVISGDASVSTVAQIATSITATAVSPTLMANAVDSTTVTAVVRDQAGQPMLVGIHPLTFAITGKGTFAAGAPVSQWVVGTSAPVTVNSIQGDPGAIAVSVTSPALATGVASITTHIAGVPAGIRLVVADTTITAADLATFARFRVELVDAWGRTTPAPAGGISFTVGIPPAAELVHAGVLSIPAGATTSGDIDIRPASAADGIAGTHPITVTAGAWPAQRVDVVVAPGPARALFVVSPVGALRLPATVPSATVTVRLRDLAGNNVALAGATVAATWADAAVANHGRPTIGGVFNPGVPVNATTDAAGVATFAFSAEGFIGDDYTLTFTSTVGGATFSIPTGVISLVARVPAALTLAITVNGAAAASIPADDAFTATVTVTARDAHGVAVADWPIAIAIPAANRRELAPVVAAGPPAFVAGVTNSGGQVAWTFRGALAGSYTVTATAGEMLAAVTGSVPFATVPGTVIAGAGVQTAAGAAVTALAVTAGTWVELRAFLRDAGGNPIVNTGVPRSVGLSSTGVTGVFREVTTGVDVGAVPIPTGTLFRSVWFRPATPGTADISATTDLVAPTLVSIAAPSGGTTITLTFSEAVHWGAELVNATHIVARVAGADRVVTTVPIRLPGAAGSTLAITIGGAAITLGQVVEVTITAAGAGLIRDGNANALVGPVTRSVTAP